MNNLNRSQCRPSVAQPGHTRLTALLSLLALFACSEPPPNDADDDLDAGAAPDAALDAADVADADADEDSTDGGNLTPPEPMFWPERDAPTFDNGFAEAHPEVFGRISRWSTHLTPETRPGPGALGAFGFGNGHVFAFVGYADPVSTLHTMAGPTYDKLDGFFGDYVIALETPEGRLGFDEEWAGLSLDAPVAFTRGRAGGLELDTIDFAPWTDGPERFCVVRVISVRNRGEPVEGLRLVVDPYRLVNSDAAVGVESREDRFLSTGFSDGEGSWADGVLGRAVDELAEGEELTVELLHCAAEGAPPSLPDGSADDWIARTAEAYQSWEANLVDVELPDPMLSDFIDGMKRTLITQTASTGAAAVMSQYTGTWARDNIGPALAWLALGGHEDARRMMDYLYGAILLGGDLANSYLAALDVSSLPPVPDWAAMPSLTGRVGAETPSYMVWIYGDYLRASGDETRVDERWGFIERCLFAQEFTDDDLLAFTDDETFRAAMNVAAGLLPEYPHLEKSLSANSSFLWLGAARRFIAAAGVLGRDGAADRARIRYAEVESAALDTYLLDDGCFSAFIDRESQERFAPFEDVATKVTWAGWLDGDDPRAAEGMRCLIERFGLRPGVIRSPLDDSYVGVTAFGEGVYTGMLPGYTLAALTDIGHPDAESALLEMAQSVSTSGNFQEYYDSTTEDGLQFVYDPSGAIGDYTAKFRPWEGGINLAAVLDYLIGWVPDARAQTVAIRPHLPAGWPSMALRNLRVGDDRFDIELERDDDGLTITIVPNEVATDYDFTLRWDHAGETPNVAVNGEDLARDSLVLREHFGVGSFETPRLALTAGRSLEVRIRE